MKSAPKALIPALLALAGGAVGWFAGALGDRSTTISFISVGQGDCTVLSSQGYTVLIDDGPADPRHNAMDEIVIPWLTRHGYHHVDAVFLSHPDEDHVGGTPSVVAKYHCENIVVSDQFQNDPEMTKRLFQWHYPPAKVTWLPKFSEAQVGDAHLTIECPDRPAGLDANSGSMFVRVSQGAGSIVLSGDAPKEVEKTVEGDEHWTAEIVHLGHHGSKTASDPTYLRALNPQYAIISVGRNNRYGHPHPQTLATLEAAHIPYFRTDLDGTITFRFDGKTFVKE